MTLKIRKNTQTTGALANASDQLILHNVRVVASFNR